MLQITIRIGNTTNITKDTIYTIYFYYAVFSSLIPITNVITNAINPNMQRNINIFTKNKHL